MFKERKKALTVLNNAFSKERFEFFIIYGKRRIGKSALIKEFVKNKPHIFFTALKNSVMFNLKNLSGTIKVARKV